MTAAATILIVDDSGVNRRLIQALLGPQDLNLRPLDPQSSAACSPSFANNRILSATNDLDAGEHSRTSAKSAVWLHIWLHDLSAQALTEVSEGVGPLHRVVPGVPSVLPSAKLGWGLPEFLTP
jgi:CheY-like chemotaxis protein